MSHLELAAEAPFVAHIAAATALLLHVGGGSVAIVSGYVAMAARKGGRLHRKAGNVFFAAMLAMTGVAVIVAPMLPDAPWTNTTAAVFTLYMTLTAWLAAKRRPGEAGAAEAVLIVVPVGVAAMALWIAASGRPGDFATVYAFGVISAGAAVADVSVLRRGGLMGAARTARHVWRISAAFFVATGSFFFGQQAFLPEPIRQSVIPYVLGLAPLALMAFWLVRVRLPRRARVAA